jgi:hypothetical protein
MWQARGADNPTADFSLPYGPSRPVTGIALSLCGKHLNKNCMYLLLSFHVAVDELKLRGFGPRANYADPATAACWRSSANFCG